MLVSNDVSYNIYLLDQQKWLKMAFLAKNLNNGLNFLFLKVLMNSCFYEVGSPLSLTAIYLFLIVFHIMYILDSQKRLKWAFLTTNPKKMPKFHTSWITGKWLSSHINIKTQYLENGLSLGARWPLLLCRICLFVLLFRINYKYIYFWSRKLPLRPPKCQKRAQNEAEVGSKTENRQY